MRPVSETFQNYLNCGCYSESSQDSKGRAVKFFLQLCGDLSIEQVAYGHAEDFQRWLRSNGRAAKTVNLYVTHINHFFKWASRRGYIQTNPFAGIVKLNEEVRKGRIFNDIEIARMMRIAPLRWKVLILLGLCGMRAGEALNLVVRDLRFDEELILISSKKDTAQTWRWQIKNRREAYSPFPAKVAVGGQVYEFHSLVLKLLDFLPHCQPYICVKPAYYEAMIQLKDEGRLPFRKRLTPWGNFDRDFKYLLSRACVERKSFHDLRRTFATKLCKTGYNLKEAQSLLRHRSIQTTALYYVVVDERSLVARVNNALKHYEHSVP